MRDEKRGLGAQRASLAWGIGLAILFAASSARSGDEAPIAVSFQPGEAGSKLAPRYSPKGYRVPLAPSERDVPEGVEVLEGRLRLGPEDVRGDGHLLVLARSVEGQPFDRLWIDTDADGSIEDEETRTANPSTKRGTVYTSYDAVVRVNHGSVEEPACEPYPIGLWVAVESEDAVPPFIRYSRRGFLVASVEVEDVGYHVVLSDADNDGVYGTGDWWTILPVAGGTSNDLAGARKVGDFAWADRKAWRLELEGTRGRTGRLVAVDPGLTPEEDARARDPYWDDRHAERAEKPVTFHREVEAAIEDAGKRQVPYFLDFETVWCGPCKTMDRWVYTAQVVVTAAEGIVCIKVDGDEREDLKERHGVGGFPTGILFRPGGEEIARFGGYQSCKDMVAFFAQARAAPEGGE